VADPIDQASERAALLTDTAVAAARGQVPDPSQPGPAICEVCEDNAIPEGRRRLGHRDCIECARERERRGA
jgi:hypothetical protein